MIRNQKGFTLVELIVTMTIFVLVIAAASGVFTGLLTQFKQQSKITETNIEGALGLEILRHDLASAGFGIPWHSSVAWNTLSDYTESSANPRGLDDAPTNAPRGIISENNASFASPDNIFDGSDYLAIKAINIADNEACTRWTTLKFPPFVSPDNPRVWEPASPPELHNLINSDHVIVLEAGENNNNAKTLIVDGTTFYATYSVITSSPWPPIEDTETNLVYGITEAGDTPVRPFNRADYFITTLDENGNDFMPERCAPNTGVLVKAFMNHDATGTYTYLPLLDCVADFQVVYLLDTDIPPDGIGDLWQDDISALTEVEIKNQIKLLEVSVLAHEGQYDPTYTYPSNTIDVQGQSGNGRTLNLTTAIGTTWDNYRWKVYTIILSPLNLG